jgi:hypothetical protein
VCDLKWHVIEHVCDYLCYCADCVDVHESDEVEKSGFHKITATKPDIIFKKPEKL